MHVAWTVLYMDLLPLLLVLLKVNVKHYCDFWYPQFVSFGVIRKHHVYNRNTAWLRDTVRQTSRGKSAAAGRTAGPPRPLTSRGTSAWPYRVTTQYSFYPVQMYKLTQQKWSFEIINPMIYHRMAYPRTREVASQATNSIWCPRTAQAFMHLLNITQDCT